MRLAVVTITCRVCGRVTSQSIPRVAEPDEIDNVPTPCSPAFAKWATCPEHPPAPPDLTPLVYSKEGCPLLWTVRVIDVPGLARPA